MSERMSERSTHRSSRTSRDIKNNHSSRNKHTDRDGVSPQHSESSSSEKSLPEKKNRVYVGNIAWETKHHQLRDHMSSLGGKVIYLEIFRTEDGSSRGCGIVEYETIEEAREAIDKLNNTELSKRKLFVREDRAERRPSHPDRGSRRRHYSREREYSGYGHTNRHFTQGRRRDWQDTRYPPPVRVKVRNLPSSTTWQDLKDLFNENRRVEYAQVYNNQDNPYGILVYPKESDAMNAIDKYDKFNYRGKILSVSIEK